VRLLSSPRRWLVREITRILTAPLPRYELLVPNDFERLKRHVRKGDLILVDGEQRVSLVIKYLTQSQWSHVVVFVGDEMLRRFPERRSELVATYGDEADHLILEALMEGVVVSPLSKYLPNNIRVCRPYSLRKDDRDRILDELLARVGHAYDIKNIIDLARYFFPVSLIPQRFRRRALTIGSGDATSVICSSMIAQAFQNVGFPILPKVLSTDPTPPPTGLRRLFQRGSSQMSHYVREPVTLVTPRDFDISPYFEIVKFNVIEDMKFDYRKIRWADDRDEAS